MYEFGTIVLIPFPYTDLTSAKLRPALIVSKKHSTDDDVIVCFITSNIYKPVAQSDFLIEPSSPYFKKTGLKTTSVIRLNKIATLSKKMILGELGKMPQAVLKKVGKKFFTAFGF